MPIREALPRVTIKLKKEIQPIIDLYVEVLSKHQIPVEDTDQGAKADVAVGETRLRNGLWNRYVTSNLESLSGVARGAKAVTLEAVDIEFTPPAEILRRCYVAFLNAMLLREGLTPEHTQGEVTSKYAVVHLLLNRLVSVALDNKLDAKHDGERLLAVLEAFVDGLTQHELLYRSKRLGDDEVSHFLKDLSTQHPKWNAQIKHMVNAIKTIHAPRQAVTEALTRLKQMEKALQRQLIAFLDPGQKVAAFASDWLDTQLSNIERKFIVHHASPEKRAVIQQGDQQAVHQLVTVITREHLEKSRQQKIERLYEALEQTRTVQEIFSQFDLLITTGGWIPILAGVLNVSAFSQLLKDHSKRCETALALDSEQSAILDQVAGRGLLRYQAATGEGLQALMLESGLYLDQLLDRSLRQQVHRLIGASVLSLMRLQDRVKGAYRLINAHQLAAMGLDATAAMPALIANHPVEASTPAAASQPLLLEQHRRLSQSDQSVYATQTLHSVLAANCQDMNCLAVLQRQGADLSALQLTPGIFQGYSALHIAVSQENWAACQWLLDQGVDVNLCDSRHETSMDKASKRGVRHGVDWLRERGGKSTLADTATQQLHELIDDEAVTDEDSSATTELMETLFDALCRGADINGINRWQNAWHGDRPLHTLLVKGNQRLITWFITMGAKLQLKDVRHQETPIARMYRAKAFLREQTMAFLKENFADQLPQEQSPSTIGGSSHGVFQPQKASALSSESSQTQEPSRCGQRSQG